MRRQVPKMDPDFFSGWHRSTQYPLPLDWYTKLQIGHKMCKKAQYLQIHKEDEQCAQKCTFDECKNVHSEHSKWTQGKQNVQLVAQNVSQYKPSWSYAHTCVNIWAQTAN